MTPYTHIDRRPCESIGEARRWVPAPHDERTSSVPGVWLSPGESVIWRYTYRPGGKVITGYSIGKR